MNNFKILKPVYGKHDGSSFREIIEIWREKKLCEVENITNVNKWYSDETQLIEARPWVNKIGDILLYDNPILDKIHSELKWNLALFANEVMKGPNCYAWTFWPNHPKIHEAIRAEGIPNYQERKYESVFLGTFTTNLRQGDWKKHIQHYWMGRANERAMSQEDYLRYLRDHKFGLCLPGVGPKCLRDMELIGLGTVPIFTPGVSTEYYNKLELNKHYLFAENPEEVKTVIENCTQAQWEYMSSECLKWFNENSTPEGVLSVTKQIINNHYTKI